MSGSLLSLETISILSSLDLSQTAQTRSAWKFIQNTLPDHILGYESARSQSNLGEGLKAYILGKIKCSIIVKLVEGKPRIAMGEIHFPRERSSMIVMKNEDGSQNTYFDSYAYKTDKSSLISSRNVFLWCSKLFWPAYSCSARNGNAFWFL